MDKVLVSIGHIKQVATRDSSKLNKGDIRDIRIDGQVILVWPIQLAILEAKLAASYAQLAILE